MSAKIRQSVPLGSLFGIKFDLHITWFILFILVTLLLVRGRYDHPSAWILAIITSLLFFSSVAAHELAHCLVGKIHGIPISGITLFIFGGIARMEEEVKRPLAEFTMAIAGPVCSLLLGAFFGMLWLFFTGWANTLGSAFSWLAIMNFVLVAFNLIPAFPLDGGRVFHSFIWTVTGNHLLSSHIASFVGQVFGYLIIALGILIIVFQPFTFNWFDGVWVTGIGWFLRKMAQHSYKMIVMSNEVKSVPVSN